MAAAMEMEGGQMAAPLADVRRKSNIGGASSVQRQKRASRISKSWMGDDAARMHATVHDADQAGVDLNEATKIVKCTTRFATAMCCVIAFVKVSLYFALGAEVIRTSALDSVGDLFANCISMYTGYRMTKIERKRYPVGQGKFQSIGCLVFATFMFALMFGNALGNVESLIESKDDVGFAAITRFFHETEALGGDFKDWHKEVDWRKDGQKVAEIMEGAELGWANNEISQHDEAKEIDNPLKQFFLKSSDPAEEEMAKRMPDKVTRGWIVAQAAEYENQEEKKKDLFMQNQFLACCATYKLFLWLYCVFYAIPKSGSSVLVALANDKRNDFIGTYSVIAATFFCFYYQESVNAVIAEEKVDPLVSLILSFAIMVSWMSLMVEHMTILSQESGDDEYCQGIRDEVALALDGTPCHVEEDDIKVYKSSEKHTIDVCLTVTDGDTNYSKVAKTSEQLTRKLLPVPDVENVVITTRPARSTA